MSAFTEPTFAWEPLTPRGVAAFARASLGRLFLVQSLFALLAAGAVCWFLSVGIFPVINTAVQNLPPAGNIQDGLLDWRADSPVMLAENSILAISVDLNHSGALHSPADFQVELGRNSVCIFSLFGEAEVDYPAGYTISVNQPEVEPIWGAWAPDILGLAALGTFFGLLLVWALLALIYSAPTWLICFYANRDLKWAACWRLAGAALLPGATLITVSLVLYGLRIFGLVQLLFALGLHLVIGWIYLFVSPLFLNRALPTKQQNPFGKQK